MSSLYIISCLTALHSEHLKIYTTAVEPHNFMWSKSFSELNTSELLQFWSTLYVHVYKILGITATVQFTDTASDTADVKESV